MEYPKIDTVFDRDPETFKIVPGKVRLPEFDLVKSWLVTEKIHGDNVRAWLKPGDDSITHSRESEVKVFGRTAKADMKPGVKELLESTFSLEKMVAAFGTNTEAIVFGEAYGPGIQKGGSYRSNKGVRIFDVVVFGPNDSAGITGNTFPWWLNWSAIEDVARKLDIQTVPVVDYELTLDKAQDVVQGPSLVAAFESETRSMAPREGIVARTEPLLFNRRGQRVVWKLKAKDLEVATSQPAFYSA